MHCLALAAVVRIAMFQAWVFVMRCGFVSLAKRSVLFVLPAQSLCFGWIDRSMMVV